MIQFCKLTTNRISDTCALYALSIFLGVSYDKVLFFTRRYIASKRGHLSLSDVQRGFYPHDVAEIARAMSFRGVKSIEEQELPAVKLPTTKRFVEAFPIGRAILFVNGHAFAVIDGTVHDTSFHPRRRVYGAVFFEEGS